MKITKRRLRQIIKEEKARLLGESRSSFERALEAREMIIDNMNGGADQDEIFDLLEELYPDLRNDWTAIINDAVDLYDIRGLR